MSRVDGRIPEQLRSVKIERNYTKYAEGSVLIKVGDTQVLCTASIEDKVPPFLRGSGEGWITAEYSMLPRATQTRNQREASKGKLGGRTMEIQRLIGRSLRSVVNLKGLGEKTLWIDCDVLQADGGTRTAAITGSFVALVDALYTLMERGVLSKMPLTDFLAATSVGIVGGKPVVDLCYAEDSKAEVDMNLVMTGAGEFVEVQGTAEGAPFNRENLNELLELGTVGISQLILIQKQSLGSRADLVGVKA